MSVVIPTLGRSSLGRVLDLLEQQTASPARFELLLVADASTAEGERLSESVGRRPYRVRTLRGDVPGASAARNRGWRAAASELVMFMGDDILPHGDLVSQHLEWHRREPQAEVGVLGHVSWARELRVTPFMRWLDQGPQFGFGSIVGEEATWSHFYTANVSLKRSMLERVGGFDESFPFLYEDLDLAKRMHELGFRLLYNREAKGEHLHAATLAEWQTRIELIATAEHYFVRKHPDTKPYWFDQLCRVRGGGRGRAAWLAGLVPRRVPWLGPRVWESARASYRRQLAGPFMAAWERADAAAYERKRQ